MYFLFIYDIYFYIIAYEVMISQDLGLKIYIHSLMTDGPETVRLLMYIGHVK